jgi:hypothetical protein
VAALESDLERVLADERDVLDEKLVRIQALDPSQAPRDARLAATFGARAGPAQALTRIGASVPVLPSDDHDLAFAVDVDRERIGVWIFQGRGYLTLITGSWRND